MAMRKIYLRQYYQAEQAADLVYPLPKHVKDLGAIAYKYQLGSSASLTAVLSMDSPLRESLHDQGISMHKDAIPSDSNDAVWKFSSRSIYGDTMHSFSPWNSALLTDHEHRMPHEIGEVVVGALRDMRSFLERYDSNAGESFYFLDFITARSHQLI